MLDAAVLILQRHPLAIDGADLLHTSQPPVDTLPKRKPRPSGRGFSLQRQHIPTVYDFITIRAQRPPINPLRGNAMSNIAAFCLTLLAVIWAGSLAGCHDWEPVPPGQVKHIVNPPPGHGGIPPGQLKKY
jgi:hypothetical protein